MCHAPKQSGKCALRPCIVLTCPLLLLVFGQENVVRLIVEKSLEIDVEIKVIFRFQVYFWFVSCPVFLFCDARIAIYHAATT